MMSRFVGAGRLLAIVCLVLPLSGSTTAQDARTVPPNTWINLRPGGVAAGTGVGDEGYNSFVYAPGLRKALVFAQYHANSVTDGEDQNALLAFDFALNRWDLLEVTEAAWSEFLPGVGHDQGNVAVDTLHDLYVTKGNQTLHGNTAHTTYLYDLRAGRGKRMMPPAEPYIGETAASAFDPDHDLVLTTKGPSWLYDHTLNAWTEVRTSPSYRVSPGLVYDTKQRVFVMFGGSDSDETWTFDAGTRVWTKKHPPVSPPGRTAPNMAFDGANGVVLLVGGHGKGGVELSDAWVYDTALDRWRKLPVSAPPGTNPGAGNNLTYDSHHQVFLLKSTTDLRDVWAFKYVPLRTGGSTQSDGGLSAREAARPIPSPTIRAVGAESAARPPSGPMAAVDLPLRTWAARPLPERGKGPTAGKHMRLAYNSDNGRIYFLGGDYSGPLSQADSGRREVYSYDVADGSWRLEHPYCAGEGEVQPANPDEVGWTYDAKRKLFWMFPGYLAGSPWDEPCPRGLVQRRIMTFHPLTRKWTATDRTLNGYGESFKFAVHDPIRDTIIRFYYSGADGASSQVYHIPTDTYAVRVHRKDRNGVDVNNARLGEEYAAIDVEGRVIWLIEPVEGRLYKYEIDTGSLAFVANTPIQNRFDPTATDQPWPWDSAMPVWDSVNKVVLWPHISDFSRARVTLYIYDPRTKVWERDAMVQLDGRVVRGNSAVFDPVQNALLILGGTFPSNPYLFLYRYGGGSPKSGPGATRP